MVLLHPEVARRPCDECRGWLYDDRPGAFAAERMVHGGKPVPRPAFANTPCFMCPKQPDGVPPADRRPGTAVEPDARFWAAKQFYDECRAVGQFPADPLVRAAAAVFARAYHVADLVTQARLGG